MFRYYLKTALRNLAKNKAHTFINLSGLAVGMAVAMLIALINATPAAYYFMHNWLQQYNYRISISWWVFVVTGIAALLITLITISYQTIKIAFATR